MWNVNSQNTPINKCQIKLVGKRPISIYKIPLLNIIIQINYKQKDGKLCIKQMLIKKNGVAISIRSRKPDVVLPSGIRLHPSTAGGTGSVLGQGTKIPNATKHNNNRKKVEK